MGTPVFFFFLLWSRKVHPVIAGGLTGSAVVFFRLVLDKLQPGSFEFLDSFRSNFPSFFYYVVFAAFFNIFKLKKLYQRPLFIGLLGIVLEIAGNTAEIFVRHYMSQIPISFSTFLTIGGVAIIRSFFVLGFFNILLMRETKLAEEEKRKRAEQILLLISNLNVEMFQLKKSTKNAEELTSACYKLYRDLKEQNYQEPAQTMLKIAGELHEIKKDNQRIYAGLSKLMAKEKQVDFMGIERIISIIVHSNKNYVELLGKTIDFHVNITGEHQDYHTFTLFSLINNLVANAVEAIEKEGRIVITVERVDGMVKISTQDNGCGIPPKNKLYIFEPGFTTKFDHTGIASNGIGLSYIKNVIENLGGEIKLADSMGREGTTFEFQVPIASLIA